MAETLTARIALDGGKEIKAELESLGSAGKKAFEQLKAAAEKVNTPAVRFSAAVTKLRGDLGALGSAGVTFGKDLVAIEKAFDRVGKSALNVAKNVGLVTAAVVGVGVAVLKFAQGGAEAAVTITNQSRALGLTTDAYQDLSAVAKQANLDQSQFQRLVSRFTIELAENSKKASSALKLTGSDVAKLNERISETNDDIFNTGVKITTLADAETKHKKATDASTLSMKGLGVTTLENGEAVIAYAKKLETLKTSQERLLQLTKDFGRKEAVSIEPFFNQLIQNLEATGKVAGDALPGLSALELELGLKLDKALGDLGVSLQRTTQHLQLLFAPAVTQGVEAFDALIHENQKTLQDFAQTIISRVQPVIADLFNAILGRDEKVQNPAILQMRDQIIQFADDLRIFVFEKAIPAFHAFVQALQVVSDAWNALLGRHINAQRAIIFAIIAQLLGVVKLVIEVFKLAALTVKGFFNAFKLAGTVLTVLRSIGVVLFEAVAGLATFVAGLIGLPIAIVVGIAAALVAAGVAIFVFWDDIKAAAIEAWDDIKAGASVAADVIEATWTALVKTFDTLIWEPLKASTAAAWEDIKTIVSGAIGLLVVIGNRVSGELKAALAGPAEVLKSIWDGAVTAVLGSLNRLLDGAKSVFNFIVTAAKAAARAIASAFSAAKSGSSSSSSSSSGSQIFGRARGGPIRGAGTATSDSILLWGSNGEFMMKTAAVRKYGVGFMQWVNSLRMPKELLRGFAGGGLLTGLGRSLGGAGAIPAFASGGPVRVPSLPAPGRPLSLTIDGQTFSGLIAPVDVAGELTRFAMRRQLSSGGKKPSWYGRG